MKALAFTLILTSFLTVSARIVQFKQAKRSLLQRRDRTASVSVSNAATGGVAGSNSLDLGSVQDLIYLTNVTAGGNPYIVQLDTGSSDFLIKGATSPLPNSQRTSITYNITYGIGWAYGYVGYVSAEFAGIQVSQQAFLDVSSAQNPAFSYGADGIVGLGFNSLSNIDTLINGTHASTGRSLLYNLFAANPSEPNFVTFALQRSNDPTDNVTGIFSIGEYISQYAGIADTPAIPTWPVQSPARWNVLLDSFIVNGAIVSVTSSVSGAPSNSAVVLLDSGTSYTYAPESVCNAIYQNIPNAYFDSSLGQWVIPCDSRIDMALQIGGRVFPLHPLDITPRAIADSSMCVGSFVPQPVTVGKSPFDWLIGDNVLRSVYSAYDFGDFGPSGTMGTPYVKLFSIIDPNVAAQEFEQERGGSFSGNITYNASNSTASTGQTSLSLSDNVAEGLAKIGHYMPVVLGVLGLNVLVMIVLVILTTILLCRSRTKLTGGWISAKKRKNKGRAEPPESLQDMPMNPTISGTQPPNHAYEALLTAMTEETIAPPSPAQKMRYSDVHSPLPPSPFEPSPNLTPRRFMGPAIDDSRRVSTAHSENFVFAPPSPGFRMVDHERPRSIA